MSFIKFESSRVKESERRETRRAREKVLDKAKKDYFRRKEEEIHTKLRGDDKWMLPSVESRLDNEFKKKRKKNSKHKKKKRKSRKRSSSSSSESGSEEKEWVEKDSSSLKKENSMSSLITKEDKSDVKHERDEWMNLTAMHHCVSRKDIKQNKMKDQKAEDQRNLLDKPGQSARELNPYWRDGGTGLPENNRKPKGRGRTIAALGGVGDRGVDWLRRALKRSQEQAEEEGRALEDVVGERWGSLEELKSMIQETECREGRGKRVGYECHGREEERWRGEGSQVEGRHSKGGSWHTLHHPSHPKGVFRKPVEVDEDDAGEGSSQGFRKPEKSDDWHLHRVGRSSKGNWRKKGSEEEGNGHLRQEKVRRSLPSGGSSEGEEDRREAGKAGGQLLTGQEMNELGAKLLKAEILGNEGLAKELKAKLEKAREIRKRFVVMAGEGVKECGGDVRGQGKEGEEVVVLTRTTWQGLAHPVASLDKASGAAAWGGKRKKRAKVETHMDGKRVRYFADDDKYSLKEMFEQEKLNTVESSNEIFSKIASKGVGKPETVNDMDDVFEESARYVKSAEREEEIERGRAIAEHREVTKALDSCQWCLDSKLMLKHLIVAIGTKAYLCLPAHQSLTEGHCMIVPMGHMACGTMVDEDVWTEIQEFRKALTKMFLAMNQDCVFFETAINLKCFPHMVLECVPMEKETGDLAPIYFKKAIQECEMEWSNNKKVVDLVNKDVRRAIPKGLPYFGVDFGLQSGFAHVIEDERRWPHNFAQEIIGGMLDLDHLLWRKRRLENFDNQRRKVLQFAKWWKDYDWTQNLKEK